MITISNIYNCNLPIDCWIIFDFGTFDASNIIQIIKTAFITTFRANVYTTTFALMTSWKWSTLWTSITC